MNYSKKSISELNEMLPKGSNWKVISNDGHIIDGRQKKLLVTAQCKCGNICQKIWSRLQEGRFYSCGCVIEKCKVKNLRGEIWEAITGYEGIYEVSSLGRVKRINKIKKTKVGSVQFFKERLLTPARSKGYVIYCLTDMNVNASTERAHILVAREFIPNHENLPEVNHKDTIKHHNWIDNLEWSTHKANMTHAKENGLLCTGEDAFNSILKEKDVLEIRKKYKKNEYTMSMIGDEYGVSISAIQSIIEKRTWKHI